MAKLHADSVRAGIICFRINIIRLSMNQMVQLFVMSTHGRDATPLCVGDTCARAEGEAGGHLPPTPGQAGQAELCQGLGFISFKTTG